MSKQGSFFIILLFLPSLIAMACSDNDGFPLDEESMEPWQWQEVRDSIGCSYGVRWQTGNPNDLGQRCFDATGLRARFGVGRTPGNSDFDQVYPWSAIRRCNVKVEGQQTIVTYDDEPGFSLDGSNGDVFVRIPKFYVEKYQAGGYEYRVISGKGSKPHPAFIENGEELDAVYVSAFEGYVDSDSLLRSVANTIPTSNITAQRFLDAAQRRGPQYTLYDMRTVDMLFSLIAVEFGCRNTGRIFGHGIADYRQPLEKEWDESRIYYSRHNQQHTNTITCKYQELNYITKGSAVCICKGNQLNILTFAHVTDIQSDIQGITYTFDGPPIDITTDCFIGNCAQSTNWTETCSAPHTSYMGRANMLERQFSPRDRNPMRYRWMENLVGNVWHFLPDLTFSNCQMYVCKNMTDYRFATVGDSYQPYGTPLPVNNDNGEVTDRPHENYWVTSLMSDDQLQGVTFGNAYSKALTSEAAFGAYYYVNEGLNIVVNGGGFDHRARCNILTTRAWIKPSEHWHLYGARLLFKDIRPNKNRQ